jgi:AcrR family transcriptional regulator
MAARVGTVRARDAESEATRRTILESAAHLLASGGAERLSIRELCARAGVTPPTIYHHFGDKAALIDRVVDDCFAEFDRAFARRAVPADPVEALRWSFGRYVEFGTRYPEHYRVMFEGSRIRPTTGARASYDALRRRIAAIHAVGRLQVPIEEGTAASWAAVHGVTSLAIRGVLKPQSPAIALVREALITQLTRGARRREPRLAAARTERSRQ